jgi:hypothetical protein
MKRSLQALCVVVTALFAHASHAQVAVAVNLSEDNAVHRDIAAGVVAATADKWALTSPQLLPSDVDACRADVSCLTRLAGAHGASHVMLVGVATLSPREAVLSLQLFDAHGTKQFEDSAVLVVKHDARAETRALLAPRLAAVTGPPSKIVVVTPPPKVAHTPVLGVSLLGAGGAVAAATVGTSLALLHTPDVGVPVAIAGAAVSVVLVGAGCLDLLVDGP